MNRRFHSGVFVAISGLLCLLSTVAPRLANAHQIVVNDAGDPKIFGGCSLRRAIQNHNDESQPNPQCGAGSANDTIIALPLMDINGALPVIRNTLTIDRPSLAPCGQIVGSTSMTLSPGSNVTLRDVGIDTNNPQESSLVNDNGATLTIEPRTDELCRFSNEKSGNSPLHGGILIVQRGGTATITAGNFVNSSAVSQRGQVSKGGAIYILNGTVNIDNFFADVPIRFTDDSADDGGAIYVEGNTTLKIASNNFTFINNQAGGAGAAIFSNGGIVSIQGIPNENFDSVSIAQNRSGTGGGGAIFSDHGTLTIDGIQIFNNATSGSGGAVAVAVRRFPGRLQIPATITNTYFHDNSANSSGGAVYIGADSSLNASGDTFANDASNFAGGGIYLDTSGSLKVLNSTFVGSSKLEGITIAKGSAEVVFSTLTAANLVGNSPAVNSPIHLSNSLLKSVSCDSSVVDDGFNLQFSSAACPTSIPDMNPLLATLQDNGGPTPTIAVLEGSPAIGAIPNADCTDQDGNPITTDERGFPRPGDGPGGPCTIGAFEFQVPAP